MNLIKYTFLCYYHKNQKTPQKYGFIRTQSTQTHGYNYNIYTRTHDSQEIVKNKIKQNLFMKQLT